MIKYIVVNNTISKLKSFSITYNFWDVIKILPVPSPLEDKVLFEISDKGEIKLLIGGISFVPSIISGRCECIGEMIFEFYKGNEKIQSFSFHHGTHIRPEHGSPGDIYLTEDSRVFLGKWLKEKGIGITQ